MDIDAGTRELFAVNALTGDWSPDGTTHAYVLSRPDVPAPGEWALAVRQSGGPERTVGGWSKESVLMPTGWTPDGRSVLGSYVSPLYTKFKVTLWRISEDGIPIDKRILIDDPLYHFFQASFSPDGGWLSFVALPLDQASRLVAWVAPAAGTPPSEWRRIASSHDCRQAALGARRTNAVLHFETGLVVLQPLGRSV